MIKIAALVLIASVALAATKEKEAPSWVTEVATRVVPVYSGKVPAVVLLDEQHVTVQSTGMVDTLTRHAVKILNHEGKKEAAVVEGYEKGGRQVKELHAWLIAPGGFVKTYDKGSVQDLGAYSDELYNDYRLRMIKADNAEIGAVFIYESEVQEQATAAEDSFHFQGALPSVESRYSITVPAGWSASATVLNHEPVTPVVDGTTYTWTLKGLPFRESEAAAPQLSSTSPMLAVDYHPPSVIAGLPDFKAWSDVSRWYAGIAAPQAEITPEIAAKVRDLTAGSATEYDKIRVLGHYVQKVRYVEIAMDLSHNGGVRPHDASEVFAKQYGDCKDKANLLHTMLKSAGIESYLVSIYSGDRTHVKKDWASPAQFNHMILAVAVSDATHSPTAIATSMGRLLLFDPTDYLTPMGDLPFHEQGSYALICAGAKGDIVQMPVISADSNLITQTVHARLSPVGTLTASLDVKSQGQAARNERSKYNVQPDQYKVEMERYLNYFAKGATIAKIEAHDAFDQNTFSSSLDFESPAYGQLMQGRMLVFNPSIIEPSARRFPAEKDRQEPIVLNSRLYRKQVTIDLPEGFKVDEAPSPFEAQAPFAKFTMTYHQTPGHLVMDEELRTEAVTLPATDYAEVKKFFDNALGADSQSAVLVKD